MSEQDGGDTPRQAAYDALREMYSEAEPPRDFDEALENPDEQEEDWFSNHHLPNDRQKEILDKHMDEHELNQNERNKATWTWVNYGPAGVPGNVEQ